MGFQVIQASLCQIKGNQLVLRKQSKNQIKNVHIFSPPVYLGYLILKEFFAAKKRGIIDHLFSKKCKEFDKSRGFHSRLESNLPMRRWK